MVLAPASRWKTLRAVTVCEMTTEASVLSFRRKKKRLRKRAAPVQSWQSPPLSP